MRKCEKRNMAGHFFRRKRLDLPHGYNDIVTLASCTGAVQEFSAHAYAHFFAPFLLFPLSSLSFFALSFASTMTWFFSLSVSLIRLSFRPSILLPTTLSPSPFLYRLEQTTTCACALSRTPRSLSPICRSHELEPFAFGSQ